MDNIKLININLMMYFIYKNFLFLKIWFEPMFFFRFFGSFYQRGGAADFGFCGAGFSSRPCVGTKWVRTIFKIAHHLEKVQSTGLASLRSATKSYGVLAKNLNWRFSGKRKFFHY